jgi:peroxiredoxin/mono/diheme cytochrome c family protein
MNARGIRLWQCLPLFASLALVGLAAPAELAPVTAAAGDQAPVASTLSEVPNFALLDLQGRLHELRRSPGKAVVLFFVANDCPVVRQNVSKIRDLSERLTRDGVEFLLVNASPADDARAIQQQLFELGVWHLPVAKDETQGITRKLGVRRTAEVVAISTKDWSVFYRGAIDDQVVEGGSKPRPTERYLETALQRFLEGKPVLVSRTTTRGCLITFDGGDAAESTPVSYAKEVAPLLQRKCVSCHSPGNIGDGAMVNYKKVKGMSSMIEEVLLAHRMPPWDADPQFGHFKDNPSLTTAETQTLLRWVRQGAPRGEGTDPLETTPPPAPPAEWPLGKPDIVLRLPKPETIPPTGVLDYRHVEVSAGNEQEAWVGAVWVKPGNRRVVHHVIARVKNGGQKDHLGEREMFAGWAPGSTQTWFPSGSGKRIPAHAVFDLELHYTTNGSEQTDESEIGLYLVREPVHQRFESVPVVNYQFEIQPGDPDSKVDGMYCFSKPATLHSVTPHMHLRGRWAKFEVLFPDGRRETVCSVPRYDFNWQLSYGLEKPLHLPAGTWVRLSGGFDNSARNPANPDPKKTVHWGEQSWDEMFLGWYNVTWDLDGEKKTASAR